jgi:hypothetical protein
MPKTYQVHKIIDRGTGEHQPMLVSKGSHMVAMSVTEEGMETAYTKGEATGARPLSRHSDGRVQTGRFVYVPEIAPGDVDPRTGRTAWT